MLDKIIDSNITRVGDTIIHMARTPFRSFIEIDEARERHKFAIRLKAEFASAQAAEGLHSEGTVRVLVRTGIKSLTNVLDAVIARMPTFWAAAGTKNMDLVQTVFEEVATYAEFIESELVKVLRKCADESVWRPHLALELGRFNARALGAIAQKAKLLKQGVVLTDE